MNALFKGMTAIMFWFYIVISLSLVNGITLSNKYGIPDSLRILSALKHVLRFDDSKLSIFNELYPFVTGLDSLDLVDDAFALGLEIDELPTNIAISKLLSIMYKKNDLANMFEMYYNLYPMGITTESSTSSLTTNLDGSSYFMLNGKSYNKPDDVFYLKSKELTKQANIPDKYMVVSPSELVIGTKKDAPLIIFYGCPADDQFEDFHRNLYAEAVQGDGKFRFLWRATCKLNTPAKLNNEFPLSLSLTDNSDLSLLLTNPHFPLDTPNDFITPGGKLLHLSKKDLEKLDLKVTSLIANHYYNTKNVSDVLSYASSIINNFPLYVSQLVEMDLHPKEEEKILSYNKILAKRGIDYNLLGLFLNGQHLKLSTLNEYTLLNMIDKEYNSLQKLSQVVESIDSKYPMKNSRALLNEFSTISLPHLQASQPIKIDLHRIPGFSDTVIYFNDISSDKQYSELSEDVSVFFEKSTFGELPEYKQNWNEVIFVIDFNKLDDPNNKAALAGLNRALTIVDQGYPQRIGLLPFNSENNFRATSMNTQEDESETAKIINKIYDLKRYDIEELSKFLEMLQEKGTNLKFKDPTLASVMKMPNYAKQVRDLQIYETSLIVNGEVYPFRRNTWNYLISNVVKKDADFIRQQLNAQSSRQDKSSSGFVDVRGILHLKSASSRHLKYMPEYYADALYSSEVLEALSEIEQDRVITYTFDHNYNVLHTITVVDDFDLNDTIRRVYNLLKTKFKGVRVRLIHTGDIKSAQWKNLKKLDSREHVLKLLKKIAMTKTDKKSSHSESKILRNIDSNTLKRWLPQIPTLYLERQSFFVLNGRFIQFEEGEIISKREFDDLIQKEAVRTLDSIASLEKVFPSFSNSPISSDAVEIISSILTKMYYHSKQLGDYGIEYTTETILPRMDLAHFFKENDFTIFGSPYSNTDVIELLLVVDPLEERSQKLINLLSRFEHFNFVRIKIVLFPTEKLTITPIERVYITDPVDHELIDDKISKLFDVDVDAPRIFTLTETNDIQDILLDIHVFGEKDSISEGTVDGVGGVSLELVSSSGDVIDHTITMQTFGYGQFHLANLGKNFTVRIGHDSTDYEIIGISSYGSSDFKTTPTFNVLDFSPHKLFVKVRKLSETTTDTDNESSINIFTVLMNNGEEEPFKKMILGILSRIDYSKTEKKTTFWVLDSPFLSRSFKDFIANFNENSSELGAHINLLKYEWPNWLRPQRFRNRKIAVSKLLFVDVLFPKNIDHVVYMSPTTPLLDPVKLLEETKNSRASFSLFKMKGGGYWNEGYWKKMLEDNGLSFYSVEPGFIINLNRVRELHAGDKLRLHYQRLSTDINSLLNIDQDLINNLQIEVPLGMLKTKAEINLQEHDKYIIDWLPKLEKSREELNTKHSVIFQEEAYDIAMEDDQLIEHDEL
ncbi:similar to Saccharomyces cerevisiae YOR336W KRE5 Protein required for beta-1,6 glucan biosynthesis [Maudiozyma saulgeensis]|uniref:Similar to Saccharomyces cerevisiae YOR336W KRE5 Protein required for beta-1,6 glucan biosynthesis n=1 Tax=Maudiozyma saulgeensis TaxID=1789683 RepID=A0A1X7R512_9SACH|nr:similar to Saccharomyces cerevisiae YOR336W KRE5 Protein required for beta-1,6 glucan biosynthesis [Kazachstania saulgeensis]